MNPVIIIAVVYIVLLGIIFTTNTYTALEYLVFFLFMGIIVVLGTNYFFGIQLTASLNDIFKPDVSVDIVQPVETPNDSHNFFDSKEVYHVQGQFDYASAKEVCKSYGAKLANLWQIKNSYKKGGEWCDYGWSENKMVLYPTQLSSWKKYQQTNDKKQCGIPGINGGYNYRLNQKLGANCFGKKPDGTMPVIPVQPEQVDEKVTYWQSQNLTVAPFNYTSWSQF